MKNFKTILPFLVLLIGVQANTFAQSAIDSNAIDTITVDYFRQLNAQKYAGSNISKTSFPQIEDNNIIRGPGGANQWATGTRLFFGGDKSLDGSRYNSDPIFMHRFNEAADKSTLRVCVSDDGAAAPTGQGDKMEIGYYGLNIAQWNQGVALFASGEVYAKLVKVTTSGYPDYVFTPKYNLPSLADMETHIKAKGYLPGFKPAAEVEKEGMDLGEQNKMLVEKVEELTLHLIRMQKEIDELKK